MGGAFSGRSEYATTPTVEACKSLDVNWMSRQGCFDVGASGSIQWSNDGEQVASLGYRTVAPAMELDAPAASAPDRAIVLSYHFKGDGPDDRDEHTYSVPIETTACHFGGERPWFRCPGVVAGEHCDRRVGKLYRPPRANLYLCRHCYDLGYRSSRESGDPIQKALRRFQRAQEKLGVGPSTPESGSYEDLYPDRPTGMHHSTYEELRADLDAAREQWYAAFQSTLRAMTARADTR